MGSFLGKRWLVRGDLAVFLQHADSNSAVWQDNPVHQRLAALKQAAGLDNFWLRAGDVAAVLNQLERWNRAPDHWLSGRMDAGRVGVAGHRSERDSNRRIRKILRQIWRASAS